MIPGSSLVWRWVPAWVKQRLTGRVTAQKVLTNSGWLLADQILRVGFGAILSIWIARYLGPEQLGALNYALALVALVAPIASFGLDSLVVRDLVHTPENTDCILASSIVLRLCMSAVSIFASVLLVFVTRDGDNSILVLVCIASSATLFQAISTLDLWFQYKLTSKLSVVARNLAFLTSALTKITCVFADAPLELFCSAVVLESAVCAIVLRSIFLKVGGGVLSLKLAQWSRIHYYILEARSLVLTGLLIGVYMRIDRVVIGTVLDNRAVGLYTVAVQLCEVFYILPTAVVSSLYPIFVTLYKRDEQLYTRRLIQFMRFFFYVGLVIALFFWNFGDWLVIGLFGEQFKEAVQIARVYMFLLPLVSMGIVYTHRYVLNGTTRYSLMGVVFGSVAAVLLNTLLVPVYGPVGAAWVALVVQVIPTLAVSILVDRSVGIIFLKAMLPDWKLKA